MSGSSSFSVPDAVHFELFKCPCSPSNCENLVSKALALLGSLPSMVAHPSSTSSVNLVVSFNLRLAGPLLVAASLANAPWFSFHALKRTSSFASDLVPRLLSASGLAMASTVPPTSETSYVSSRSSSSASKAARAERIAACEGAVVRSARMSSVVLDVVWRP